MPLFKITKKNRQGNKLVNAIDLEDLIGQTLKKFQLDTSGEARIVLENDGADVDDNDVLMAVIDIQNPIQQIFMILMPGEEWSPAELQSFASSPSCSSATASPQISCQLIESRPPPSCTPSPSSPFFEIPWSHFPKDVVDCCDKGIPPLPSSRNEMIRIIIDALMTGSQKPPRRELAGIAEKIVHKFPKSFRDESNGTVLGKGYESLFTQLENRVYNISRGKSGGLRKKLFSTSQEDKPNKKQGLSSLAKDSYGCVAGAWQPDAYPEGENMESQKEKQKWLQNQANLSEENRNILQIKSFMSDTYVSQRLDINKKLPKRITITELMELWPFLFDVGHMFNHCSVLLGKNMLETFTDAIKTKAETVWKFMCMRQKKASNEKLNSITSDVMTACVELSSKMPISIALVPMIVAYFREDSGFIYKLADKSASTFDVEELATNGAPVLIVAGASLFDETARSYVCIDGKVCYKSPDVLQGFLIAFSAYYCYGISYPEECSASLEYMQITLLNINPGNGTKRAGKRKKTIIHPSVVAFSKAMKLFQHENEDDSSN